MKNVEQWNRGEWIPQAEGSHTECTRHFYTVGSTHAFGAYDRNREPIVSGTVTTAAFRSEDGPGNRQVLIKVNRATFFSSPFFEGYDKGQKLTATCSLFGSDCGPQDIFRPNEYTVTIAAINPVEPGREDDDDEDEKDDKRDKDVKADPNAPNAEGCKPFPSVVSNQVVIPKKQCWRENEYNWAAPYDPPWPGTKIDWHEKTYQTTDSKDYTFDPAGLGSLLTPKVIDIKGATGITLGHSSTKAFAEKYANLDIRPLEARLNSGYKYGNRPPDATTDDQFEFQQYEKADEDDLLNGAAWSAVLDYPSGKSSTEVDPQPPNSWEKVGNRAFVTDTYAKQSLNWWTSLSSRYLKEDEFDAVHQRFQPDMGILFEATDTHARGVSFFLVSFRSTGIKNTVFPPRRTANSYAWMSADPWNGQETYPDIERLTTGMWEGPIGQVNMILKVDWTRGVISGPNDARFPAGRRGSEVGCRKSVDEALEPTQYQQVKKLSERSPEDKDKIILENAELTSDEKSKHFLYEICKSSGGGYPSGRFKGVPNLLTGRPPGVQ